MPVRIRPKLALLHGGKRGHADRHDDVDLVAALFFGDLPAARTLDGDGALHGEADVVVSVDGDALALDQLVEVLMPPSGSARTAQIPPSARLP